ncbi:hypothetical protein SUGI_0420440 [Cryptomeria japonica]|nr:hypothetical protein SUGI_0420440 [Cryptomeria japonica]
MVPVRIALDMTPGVPPVQTKTSEPKKESIDIRDVDDEEIETDEEGDEVQAPEDRIQDEGAHNIELEVRIEEHGGIHNTVARGEKKDDKGEDQEEGEKNKEQDEQDNVAQDQDPSHLALTAKDQ